MSRFLFPTLLFLALLIAPWAVITILFLGTIILLWSWTEPPEEIPEDPIDRLFDEEFPKEKTMTEPKGTPSLILFYKGNDQWGIPRDINEKIRQNTKFSILYVSGRPAGFAYLPDQKPDSLDILGCLGGQRWVQVSDEGGSDVPFTLLRYNDPEDLNAWFTRRKIFF